MCDCKDWYLIIQGTQDAVPMGTGVPRGGAPPGGSGPPVTPSPTPTPGVFGSPTETKNVGPIVGVRSKVHKEALQEWRGQKFYDEWRFIVGDADRQTGPFAKNPLKLP